MTKENIMANTSFVGPIRSKNNYKLYSTTASTGVEHDRTLGTTAKDARRVYLEEWFKQRPGLNANIDQAYTGSKLQTTISFPFNTAFQNKRYILLKKKYIYIKIS